eukprot:g16408.t1
MVPHRNLRSHSEKVDFVVSAPVSTPVVGQSVDSVGGESLNSRMAQNGICVVFPKKQQKLTQPGPENTALFSANSLPLCLVWIKKETFYCPKITVIIFQERVGVTWILLSTFLFTNK